MEKSRGCTSKITISQLLFALEYLTSYQTEAKALNICLIVRYEKNPIWIFINLKKSLEMNEKSQKNPGGILTK